MLGFVLYMCVFSYKKSKNGKKRVRMERDSICFKSNYFNDLLALLEKGLTFNSLFSALINNLHLEALLSMTRTKLTLSKE